MQHQTTESSTSRQQSPLPEAWVTRIFLALQGNYGTRFLNMWKLGQTLPDGQDAGLVNAKRVWAEKLAGFADRPECIKHVLDALPEDPPTLPQFVDLCRKAPKKELPALPHKLTEEQLKRNRERIAEMVNGLAKAKSFDSLNASP